VFEISVRTRFSAAHHLEGYPGKCAGHHGHNWEVEVFAEGTELDGMGMLLDFKTLKEAVEDVLSAVDHSDLSALEIFRGQNPSSENIAKFVFEELSARLDSDAYRISRVCVRETPDSAAVYRREQ